MASGFFCSRSETEEKPAALDMLARMPVASRPRFCKALTAFFTARPERNVLILGALILGWEKDKQHHNAPCIEPFKL